MIAEPIQAIAEELLAASDPLVVAAGRRLVAHVEQVVEMERDYGKLLRTGKAVVDRMSGSVDELVALANHVERRPVLPVDRNGS